MVKDLRPRKEAPFCETKTTDEPSDSMIFISKEDRMPVFVEKPNSNVEDNRYLHLLLDAYRDEIEILKNELGHKNIIIQNLIQVISTSKQSDANIVAKDDHNAAIKTNPFVTEAKSLSSAASGSKEKSDNEWIDSKHCSKRPLRRLNQSEKESIVLSNRFEVFKNQCEWLKDSNIETDLDDTNSSCSAPEETPESTPRPKKKKRKDGKRVVTIIGDSMIKDVKPWNIHCPDHKVYTKCFPGATVQDMHYYVKPSQKQEPDTFILHIGTNNLRSNKTPQQIAEDIIELALKMKTGANDVIISSVINRGDNYSEKARSVNTSLQDLCQQYNFYLLDNSNIIRKHLQGRGHWGGIHLNESGTEILKQNFNEIINI